MSGGSTEIVMATSNLTNSAGFFGSYIPDSKYYDLYTTDSFSTIYKKGDATFETEDWYSNGYVMSLDSNSPWISRGSGPSSDDFGIFSYYKSGGGAPARYYYNSSFRIVITP